LKNNVRGKSYEYLFKVVFVITVPVVTKEFLGATNVLSCTYVQWGRSRFIYLGYKRQKK
jgi:hypothetical protein